MLFKSRQLEENPWISSSSLIIILHASYTKATLPDHRSWIPIEAKTKRQATTSKATKTTHPTRTPSVEAQGHILNPRRSNPIPPTPTNKTTQGKTQIECRYVLCFSKKHQESFLRDVHFIFVRLTSFLVLMTYIEPYNLTISIARKLQIISLLILCNYRMHHRHLSNLLASRTTNTTLSRYLLLIQASIRLKLQYQRKPSVKLCSTKLKCHIYTYPTYISYMDYYVFWCVLTSSTLNYIDHSNSQRLQLQALMIK